MQVQLKFGEKTHSIGPITWKHTGEPERLESVEQLLLGIIDATFSYLINSMVNKGTPTPQTFFTLLITL